jgi:YD repeat-containing protein
MLGCGMQPNRGGKMAQVMPLIIAPITTKISSRKPATTSQGQVVATRDTRGTRTDYIYDDAGRRVSVVQAVGTELASQSYTCYDKAGRVRRTIANYVANGNDPDAWQADAVETWLFVQSTHRYREDNLIATTSYDAASRRQSSTSPMGNIQSTGL